MASEPGKIMVIGAGDIGRRVFHELVHSPRKRQVWLVGRDEDTTIRAVNLSTFSSQQRGYLPCADYAIADLADTARLAEHIAAIAPDVIFLAASLQSWWVISTLPRPSFERLYAANFGPWLPMHLVPVMKAMTAVRMADSDAIVVNAAYPDVVHPALAAVGLAPDLGIGNVANNVPALRSAGAASLGVPVEDVEVRLVAHHYVSHRLSRFGDSGSADMHLAVSCNGDDVTRKVDVGELLRQLPYRYRRTGGMAGQAMTAASAMSVLEPLLDQRHAVVHAPGPLGLPGGYPVALGVGRMRLDLPAGMTRHEAMEINLSGQRLDGVTAIRPDGTVEFEAETMAVMERELGYSCQVMPLAQAEDRAREITERFTSYRHAAT